MRIGAAFLVSTVLYIIPRTAALGAILLIGYLGGRRRATHVRVEAEKFTFLVPFVLAALIWGGLFFRETRIRNLLSLEEIGVTSNEQPTHWVS